MRPLEFGQVEGENALIIELAIIGFLLIVTLVWFSLVMAATLAILIPITIGIVIIIVMLVLLG